MCVENRCCRDKSAIDLYIFVSAALPLSHTHKHIWYTDTYKFCIYTATYNSGKQTKITKMKLQVYTLHCNAAACFVVVFHNTSWEFYLLKCAHIHEKLRERERCIWNKTMPLKTMMIK